MTAKKSKTTEFFIGGVAACGAGCFTNPLEVVKTRMQLQGELKARGEYAIFYRNSLHAFYTIAKTDGILALQSGLVPALWYQFFMNGVRLGTYQVLVNLGMTKNSNDQISVPRSVAAGAMAGCIGAAVGSPFYMVKTHLQSQAADEIAVGHQHKHEGMAHGFTQIYKEFGILGLWRGVQAAIARVMVGSAAQLSTFSVAKNYVTHLAIFPLNSWLNTLGASMISAVTVTVCMTPFDVVSTRLYNQGVDAHGKGFHYNGVRDCFTKIFRTEGIWGFYKGWGPSFLRLGPHTVLSLMFWDRLRILHSNFTDANAHSR